MIRGLPGSGKSHLAEALRDMLGKDRVVILDPDAIDFESPAYRQLCEQLTAEGVEEVFFPNRFLKSVGYQAIDDGKIIIWNQAFTDLGGFGRSSQSLLDYAAKKGLNLPLLVIEMQVSSDTAKARIAERAGKGGHDVPEERFARFIDEYKSFADQGYTTVSASGEDDVAASLAKVLDALQALTR